MESILTMLYNGELYPDEQFLPKSPEYTRTLHTFTSSEKEFLKILREIRPDLEEKYEEIWNNYLDVLALRREDMFRRSFTMGDALMAEVLT